MLYGLNIMSKEADGGPMASIGSDVFVGDNGASWRARALKRAKEEAHKTGKPLEEVGPPPHSPFSVLSASPIHCAR